MSLSRNTTRMAHRLASWRQGVEKNDTLCSVNIRQCFLTVSRGANPWQVHTAMVWRRSHSVDHMLVILSSSPIVRICLLPFFVHSAHSPQAGVGAFFSSGDNHRFPTHYTCREMEAACSFGPHLADSRTSVSQRWCMFLFAVIHRPSAAILVQPHLARFLTL